jgi:hypothetical protein
MHRVINRETMSTVAPATVRLLTLPGVLLVNLDPGGEASEVESLSSYVALRKFDTASTENTQLPRIRWIIVNERRQTEPIEGSYVKSPVITK